MTEEIIDITTRLKYHSRICLICGNSIKKGGNRGRNRIMQWYRYMNGYICDKCYKKRWYKQNKKKQVFV